MRYLYVFITLLQASLAFTVLPYIQIDYAHYFRLAQCLAKCMEKYGTPSSHHLLDGSVEEFLDIQNSDAEACDSGCHQHRRVHKKGSPGLTKNAVGDGQRFWTESSAESAKAGSTLISSVELICQNSSPEEEFGESAEGFVSVSLLRPSGPTRFIVQWKQRTQVMGFYDESQWITSSIEPRTFFKVDGLIPGVQYRFMITAVGPNGRIGDTVSSSWTEILSNPSPKAPEAALSIKNGYNSDRGVIAQLEWRRSSVDSCYYKLQLSNSSFQVTTDITLDSAKSILLPHLEFDADYSVTIAAVSVGKTKVSNPVTTNFKSLLCKEVHGRGSLQCSPEPVSELAVVLRSNGTALISWKPSANPQNVLFYQLVYHAISHNDGCQVHKDTVNVKSTATSVEVILPGRQCEYVIQLINYDLIGRDASAEVRILIEPTLTIRLNEILRPEIILISACVVLLSFSCLLFWLRCKRKCPNRVSEKQQKLAEYA